MTHGSPLTVLFLLRKLRKMELHKRSGRYFVYAIGEIVLIVLGILIAVQINDWNEARKTKAQEKVILAEIHEEFLYNKAEWESNLPAYLNARTSLNTLIAAFPLDVETLDFDDLAETMEGIHVRRGYDGTTASIDKLKSASFDVLSNEELRTLLLAFEVAVNEYESRQEAASRFMDGAFTPVMEAKLPRPHKEAFEDPRVDLEFLESLEFEALIKTRRRSLGIMLRLAETQGDRNISKIMDRIIELTKPSE